MTGKRLWIKTAVSTVALLTLTCTKAGSHSTCTGWNCSGTRNRVPRGHRAGFGVLRERRVGLTWSWMSPAAVLRESLEGTLDFYYQVRNDSAREPGSSGDWLRSFTGVPRPTCGSSWTVRLGRHARPARAASSVNRHAGPAHVRPRRRSARWWASISRRQGSRWIQAKRASFGWAPEHGRHRRRTRALCRSSTAAAVTQARLPAQ